MTARKNRVMRSTLPQCFRVWLVAALSVVVISATAFAQASPPPKKKGQKSTNERPNEEAIRRAEAKKAAQETRKRSRPPQPKKADGKKQDAESKAGDEKAPVSGAENGDGDKPAVEIDPELRKRIDDLLEAEGKDAEDGAIQPAPDDAEKRKTRPRGKRNRARSGASTPRSSKPSRDRKETAAETGNASRPSGPTTTLDIPPVLGIVAPEERTYFISISNGTYAQLIEGVARETGLGVIGEAPRDGKVTFVTEEELSFDELLRRVRMLLFNYKPTDPYWLVRQETHLQVIRVADYYRELPPGRMYRSRAAYREANLPKDELVLVIYTPESGSIADLNPVRDFVPDYVRVTPLEDSNSVIIFALVEHIEKYFEIESIIIGRSPDPRTVKLIEVKHISPSEAVEQLKALMDLDGGSTSVRAGRRLSRGKGAVGVGSSLIVKEPDFSVIPVDARNVIIVRAMQDKIEEIEMLLPLLDVDTTVHFEPVVIDVIHADPAELVTTIKQILESGSALVKKSGKSSSSSSKRKSKRKRPSVGRVRGRATSFANMTLIPHPVASAIIAIADEDDVALVRSLVKRLDVPSGLSNVPIALQHIDAATAAAIVRELLDAGDISSGTVFPPEVVPAPSGSALYFTGRERDLERVRELVKIIDTPEEVVSLHIATIRNHSPTFIASILQQFDAEGSVSIKPSTAKVRKSGRGKTARKTPRATRRATGKFTPDDDQGLLYILCSEREWTKYKKLIDQLESQPIDAAFVILPVENLEPADVLEKIKTLLTDNQNAKIRFETTDDGILVRNASEAELETIRALLAEFDKPIEIIQRTFEIRFADPQKIISAIQTLFGDTKPTAGKKPKRRPQRRVGKAAAGGTATVAAGAALKIVELDRFLIIETTPDQMEGIAQFIEEFDVEDDVRVVRVYEDFPPGTDLDQMAKDLESLLAGGTTKPVRGRRASGKPAAGADNTKPRIVAQSATRKMVIIAAADEFEEIEKFLEILRPPSDLEPVVFEFVAVEFADPEELISLVQPLLDLQIEQLILNGQLTEIGTPVTAGKPAAAKKPRRQPVRAAAAASSNRYYLAADERMGRIAVAGPQIIVDAAKDLIAQFDQSVDAGDRMEIAFIPVKNADPVEVVELIEPFLTLKVEEMIEAGDLSGKAVSGPKAAKSAPRGKAKPSARPRAGSGGGKPYHLTADENNARIVVLGPAAVIEEARKLIEQFDVVGDETEIVFRTVELEKADPGDMVKAIKVITGASGKTPARKGAKRQAGSAGAAMSTPGQLVVTEAPGGTALILYGPAKDVDEAEVLIRKLDEGTTPERQIKVYEIRHANIKKLVNLIMNDVDATGPGTAKKGAGPKPRARKAEADEDEEFTTEIERVGTHVYIQADLIAKTMVVSASASKLTRIDEIVAAMDADDAPGLKGKSIPKLFYDLKYTEAFDASYDLEMVIDALWEGEKPKVDYLSISETLIIKHPDESRFPEIVALIEKYVDRPDPEDLEQDSIALQLPRDGTAEDFMRWLKTKHPELNITEIDVSTVDDSTYGVGVIGPYSRKDTVQDKPHPCVLPTALQRMADAVLVSASLAGSQAKGGSGAPSNDRGAKPDKAPPKDREGRRDGDRKKREAGDEGDPVPPNVKSFLDGKEGKAKPAFSRGLSKDVKAFVDPVTGNIVVEGQRGTLKNITDLIEDYKKHLEGLSLPPDIRILQVRHIDVYKAADIINEMFNASASQRRAVQQAQRLAQQQQARQRVQQQRQAQAAKGQQGAGTQPGRQPQRPQVQMPQLPQESVRILPNPRDRTLIVRAAPTHFPVIMKLLATIDRPQPIQSSHRVYHLEKLSATDVEMLLKSWLGIGESAARPRSQPTRNVGRQAGRRGAAQPAARSTSTGARGSLPKPITMMTEAGPLNVDPHDIKISSNEASNTILVMAPVEALDYIGELIDDLESQDIAERIWKNYELKYASVEEAVEYLESRFGGGAGSGKSSSRTSGRGGRTSRTSRATSTPAPAAGGKPLNTATFVAYASLNMISAQATEEQMKEIDEAIAQLDVPEVAEEYRSVELVYCDGSAVSETLTALFGAGGPARTQRRGGRSAPQQGGAGPKFIGEVGSKVLFYSAPERLRERVLEVVAEIEEQCKGKEAKVRIIDLEFAKPTAVADAIKAAFSGSSTGGGRGARSGGRRGGAQAAASASGFTITGDDASRKLFVLSDDEQFEKIQSLITALDVPQKMEVDFRIYKLEYANARMVFEKLKNLFTEYARSQGRGSAQTIEAFAAEVDDTANALIVLGGDTVFDFVERALKEIDIPEAATGKLGFLLIPLKNADATEVAQNIARLWPASRGQSTGETPPVAEANRALNMIIVRGTKAQLDEIQKQIIDPLESESPLAMQTETIALQFADAGDVAESLKQIFEDRRAAEQQMGGRGAKPGGPQDTAVAITPDANTNQLIVQASEKNLKMIKDRIAELDREDVAKRNATTTRIYAIKNADPNTLVNVIKEWERSKQQGGGRGKTPIARDRIIAVADSFTQTVVVTASEANQALIKEVIAGMDNEELAGQQRKPHLLPLKFASAEEVATQLTQVFRNAGQKRRGDAGPAFVADIGGNSIIASLNADELEEIQALVKSLDVEPDLERGRQLKTFKLQYADPLGVQDAITQLFRGGRSPLDQVTAVPEWGSHSVIVSAAMQNMRRIEELIDNLDQEGTGQQQVHVINLETADSDSVSQTLNDIFVRSQPRQAGNQGAPITISPLRGSKAVVVRASAEDYALIEAAVKELDTEDMTIGEEVRVVTLLYSDASEVKEAMQEYLRKPGATTGRGASDLAGDVRLSVLVQTNGIMVSGDKERVDEIEQLIAQMDMAGEKGSVPQVITLTHARVGQVLATVEDMFLDSGRGGRNQQQTVIVANERMNVLLVRGPPTEVAAIQSLVEGLDTPELGEQKKFEVIKVASGINVEDLAEKIETVINENAMAEAGNRRGGNVPSITVVPDRVARLLIVSGSYELYDDAVELATALEKFGPDKDKVVRIISIVNTPKDEVIRMIEQLRGDQGRSSRGASRSGSSRRGGAASRSGGSSRRSGGAARRSGGTPRRSGTPPRRGGSTPRRRPGR